MALNISWRNHISNKDLYSQLLKLSSTIRERRKRLAGHCVRHKEDDTSKLMLCLGTTYITHMGSPLSENSE